MRIVLSVVPAAVSAPHLEPSFRVYRSLASPSYYQLSLDDARGQLAHWVMPLALKHLPKRPALLWRLPSSGPPGTLACLDTGYLQLAPAHPGAQPDLGHDLADGMLRLHCTGQLLRGYFRLKCLPEGGGQLWQLTSIGHV